MEAPGGGLVVDFDMGPMGDTYYEPIVSVPKDEAAELFESIREEVKARPGVTIAALAKEFGIRAERLRRQIDRMKDVRVIEQAGRQSPKLRMKR
jgi:hypothetical protein